MGTVVSNDVDCGSRMLLSKGKKFGPGGSDDFTGGVTKSPSAWNDLCGLMGFRL